MKLDKKALGLTLGILWGVTLFLVTLLARYDNGGYTLGLLIRIYPGYYVTYPGAFLGLVYGFVSGFLGGWVVAWLYNRLAAPTE